MPRKPKQGQEFRIEGLSDGNDPTLVDEINREPIKRLGARVPRTIEQVRAAQAQAKAEAGRALLAKAGFAGFAQPRMVAPTKPGERAIKLTEGLVLIVPAKPWRRV